MTFENVKSEKIQELMQIHFEVSLNFFMIKILLLEFPVEIHF